MIFDGEKLRAALRDRTLPVYVPESIDSTNLECRRRIEAGEGRCLVVAGTQTAGRGRNGKHFFSPPGTGLYMSLAFRPAQGAENAIGVTTYTAVAATREIARLTGRSCRIKWVNDLFLDGRKVCGILTEAVGDTLIVGVGVNLLPTSVPPELEGIVGCLNCAGIAEDLAAGVTNALLQYHPEDASHMEEYRRRSLVLGRSARFFHDGRQRGGVAVAILDDGALVVDTPDGRETLRSGEVSLSGIAGI